MDLMSIGELLGNFGEFVGAIAVVATLIYVTVQVRQNSRQKYSSTINMAGGSFAEWRMSIARDREVADIYFQGLRDRATLDSVDKMRFDTLVNQLLFTQWGVMTGRAKNIDLGGVLWVLRSRGARESYVKQKATFPDELVEAIDFGLNRDHKL